MFNQECPNAIDAKQIEREEDDGDQSDDGRVLDLVRGRPGNAAHLRARVAQKLPSSRQETWCRSCASPVTATAIAAARRQRAALYFPGRLATGRFRRLGACLLSLGFEFFFAHANFA